MALGLAGSNTFSPDPVVRIACFGDQFAARGQRKRPTQHAIIKRIGDGHGPRQTQLYHTDEELMAALAQWAEAQHYPNPEGHGTCRVPVVLLSNDPHEIIELKRARTINAAGPACSCRAWRVKTTAECRSEGIPPPAPEELDRERYFISPPDEEGMGATQAEFRTITRTTAKGATFSYQERCGHATILCNPYQCPYGRGIDRNTGKPDKRNRECRPVVDIRCRLGAWANGEMAICHAQSWSTTSEIMASLAVLFQEAGGQLAGVEVDLVLGYTRERRTPHGNRARQPFWTLQRPWEVSPEEFRQRAKAVQRDFAELRALRQQNERLLGSGLSHDALLPEFHPELVDVEGIEEVGEPGQLTPEEQEAFEALVAGGMSPAAARATARATATTGMASAGDPEAFDGGPPSDTDTDVIEGEVEEAEDAEDADGVAETGPPEGPPDASTDASTDDLPISPATSAELADWLIGIGETERNATFIQQVTREVGANAPKATKLRAYLRLVRTWWTYEGRTIHTEEASA